MDNEKKDYEDFQFLRALIRDYEVSGNERVLILIKRLFKWRPEVYLDFEKKAMEEIRNTSPEFYKKILSAK